jgi:hypothetical protein
MKELLLYFLKQNSWHVITLDTRTKKKCVCIEIRDIDKDVLKKERNVHLEARMISI